jgi:hypothetical protein
MNKAATLERPVCCGSSSDTMERTTGGRRSVVPLVLTAFASALLLISLKLPLWQMRLEAPQYRGKEALRISVHPNALRGDLKELTVLDQYIGVHVPSRLPQFNWLPASLIAGAGLGLIAAFFAGRFRSGALTVVSCALALALAAAAAQAMVQIRDIGHRRDQKTVLSGIKDFTPPFLGTSKIAQFTVSSRFGLGAWLIGAALVMQLGAARWNLSSTSLAANLTISSAKTEARLVPATR